MPQFLSYFHTPSAYRQGGMIAALIAGEFGGSLLIGFFLFGPPQPTCHDPDICCHICGWTSHRRDLAKSGNVHIWKGPE